MFKWLLRKLLGRGGSVAVELPSFMPDKPETSVEKLKRVGNEAIEQFKPEPDGTTWCNAGVHYICSAFGFKGFKGLTANLIVDRMTRAPEWAEVTPDVAQKLANDGKVVVAGIKGEITNPGSAIPLLDHGHCAVVAPGATCYSGKWREAAPMTFNVGKKNGLMAANYGFRQKPRYWALVS